MHVLFIDESRKQARKRVERVLDRYLDRIAQSTWRGRLSAEGLRVVAAQLKHRASRHTSVACYIERRQELEPAFHIGSRARFNAEGHYAIHRGQIPISVKQSRAIGIGWQQLISCVDLAALLHDIGKSSAAFQAKLRRCRPGERLGDPIRHEMISMLFIWCALRRGGDDELLKLFDNPETQSLDALYTEAAGLADQVLTSGELPHIHWNAEQPVASALLFLVATHHKLLDADLTAERVVFKPTHHLHPQLLAKQGGNSGSEAAPYPSLFQNERYRHALQRAAHGLQTAKAAGEWAITSQTLYAYGRLCLMLGDHYASALGSSRNAHADQQDQLFANTGSNPNTGKTWLAEPLADHLLSVARQARGFVRALRRSQNAFPQVSETEIPNPLLQPTSHGRFAWQGDAVAKVQAAEAPQQGFFGIVMARTGLGKTRGCPAILQAAAGRCRFFLGLGLRTLALQSGDEYAEEIGFQPWHLATIIGDETARRLHEIDRETAAEQVTDQGGSSAEEQDVWDELVPAYGSGEALTAWQANPDYEPDHAELGALGGGPGHEPNTGALPERIERALEYGRARHAKQLLRTPVIAATVDQLMSAADARGGRHLYRMLRLATSDLILDEVDSYEPEDLAAISRLVFLAGAFGRQVVIASATLPPSVSRALFASYHAGRRAYAALTGAAGQCLAGWISDKPDLTRIEPHSPDTFAERHRELTKAVVCQLDQEQPRRRMTLIQPGEQSPAAAYAAMTESAKRLHAAQAFAYQGLQVSVGVVRFANIRSCREYTRYLLQTPAFSEIALGVVCYHSRLLGVVRFAVERRLNHILKRKGSAPNARLLNDPDIQRLLGRAHDKGQRDVMILVIASPIEETGRDHDFDYAVMEPSSTRSIIQLAGRVLRHREAAPNGPNCAILDAPLRYYRGEQPPYYRYPGIETPLQAKGLKAPQLADHHLQAILDIPLLEERLDARLALLEPEGFSNDSELTQQEHSLLREVLEDGPYAALRYSQQSGLPFASWMPEHRRFRRDDASARLFLYIDEANEQQWKLIDANGETRPIGKERIRESNIQAESAFADRLLVPIAVNSLLKQLETRFGISDRERLCRDLLGTTIPFDIKGELEHDPVLGLDRKRVESAV